MHVYGLVYCKVEIEIPLRKSSGFFNSLTLRHLLVGWQMQGNSADRIQYLFARATIYIWGVTYIIIKQQDNVLLMTSFFNYQEFSRLFEIKIM